jgi:hypothetical protein
MFRNPLACLILAAHATACAGLSTTYTPKKNDDVHLVMAAGKLQYEKNGLAIPYREAEPFAVSSPVLDAGIPMFACSEEAASTHQSAQANFKASQEHSWISFAALVLGAVAPPLLMVAAPVGMAFSLMSQQETQQGMALGVDAMNKHNDDTSCHTPPTPASSGADASAPAKGSGP